MPKETISKTEVVAIKNQITPTSRLVVTQDDSLAKDIRASYLDIKEAQASYGGATHDNFLNNFSDNNSKINSELTNVANGISPWNTACDCVDVSDAIVLCQKAYWNVSIFRQTIDVQSEFCNSDIYFEGENKAAVKFFTEWDKKINGWNHRDQFFREFFRSGCIFQYRIEKEMEGFSVKRSPTKRGNNAPKIPIRYILMNPAHIKAGDASNFINTDYYKFLNNYEIARLKLPDNQLTEEEREILKNLEPDEIKKLKSSNNTMGPQHVKMRLDPNRLHTVFSKKQDYEPLAVPMYFPVLYDINLKLELKKAESIIARTVDYVTLLVKVGDKDTDGAKNQELIDGMTRLFQSQSVGRILVSDYTTKMEFLAPDLNKILGPQKYEAVNKDIADGLMNIFFKEEKFSNSSIKIKVFMERLREARKAYMENFLKPELERIGKELGFKSIPEPKFKDIDLKDEVEIWKIYNRLAELGLITPEELFEAYEGKKLPLPEDSLVAQKEYKKQKEEGLYQPILGAKNTSGDENGGGRDKGEKVKDQTKKPIGSSKAYNVSDHKSSMSKMKDIVILADKTFTKVQDCFKEKYKIKRLSKQKKELSYSIAKNIYTSESPDAWMSVVETYVNNPLNSKPVKSEILELAEFHELDYQQASFLYYSKVDQV